MIRSEYKSDKSVIRLAKEEQDIKSGHIIRILIIFAKDGVEEADNIVTNLINFSIPEFPAVKVDFFRLNEVQNPIIILY